MKLKAGKWFVSLSVCLAGKLAKIVLILLKFSKKTQTKKPEKQNKNQQSTLRGYMGHVSKKNRSAWIALNQVHTWFKKPISHHPLLDLLYPVYCGSSQFTGKSSKVAFKTQVFPYTRDPHLEHEMQNSTTSWKMDGCKVQWQMSKTLPRWWWWYYY